MKRPSGLTFLKLREAKTLSCAEGLEVISYITELEKRLKNAEEAAWPPASVQEALNSGDGSYHP